MFNGLQVFGIGLIAAGFMLAPYILIIGVPMLTMGVSMVLFGGKGS